MKKGILFDLDGTLWDASEEVAASWMLALQDIPKLQKNITREDIQGVMGKTMDEIADILFAEFSKEERKEVLAHCMEVENKYIEEHGGILMEDLIETFDILKESYYLYIVSNCQKGYIEAFLKYFHLEDYIADFESFGGTGLPKGENIKLVVERNDLTEAVYVGDTQGDYEAASYAGLPFIHARTGYGIISTQVPYIDKMKELPEILKKGRY